MSFMDQVILVALPTVWISVAITLTFLFLFV